MSRASINIEDLNPDNRDVIINALSRKPVERVRKPQTKAKGPIPPYVRVMQVWVYLVAYILLGIGWFIEHIGNGIYLLGKHMKDAARSIY